MSHPGNLIIQEERTFLGGLDPRAKVLAVLSLILTISLLPHASWLAYSLLYLLVLLGAQAAGASWLLLWRRSLVALPFLLAALAVPFVVEGPTLFQLPLTGWTVSEPGLSQGASLLLRSWIAVQCFLLLTLITPIHDIFWALEALGLPALLVSIISFTYRYLFVMAAEASRMMTARRSRQTGGGKVRLPLARRMKSVGGLLGSLFLRGLERSERVYSAMVARGYDGQVQTLHRSNWRRADSLLLAGTFLFCSLIMLVGLRQVF